MSGIFFLDLKRKISQKVSKREQQRSEIGYFIEECHGKVPKESGRSARLEPEPGNFIKYVQKPAAAVREWIQNREISENMSKSRRQRCENGSRTRKFPKICPKAGGSRTRMDPEQGNFPKYVQKPAGARREWIQSRKIS